MNALEYNTERTKLIIPEYGRHVHQMVDQAVALKDKEARNNMAKAIIGVMGNLNPHFIARRHCEKKTCPNRHIYSRESNATNMELDGKR